MSGNELAMPYSPECEEDCQLPCDCEWPDKPCAMLPTRQELAERAQQLERIAQNLQTNVGAVRMLASDLQLALALIAKYQNTISRLFAPDPNINEANPLIKKYGMTPGERNRHFAVLVDGLDITDVTELVERLETIWDSPLFDADADATEIRDEALPAPRKQLTE